VHGNTRFKGRNVLGKKSLLICFGLIALVGSIAFVSLSDDAADRSDAAPIDLAAALENAVTGDTVTLPEDTVLSRDAVIRSGVILDDAGFPLRISANITLIVEGTLISSGNLTVIGSVVVASEGMMAIDNEGNTASVSGSLTVQEGGTFSIGSGKISTLSSLGMGRLFIEGTMTVGRGALNSAVNANNTVVTGKLDISEGSTFRIHDVLTIGNAPVLTTELGNSALISGRVILESAAYVLAYGESSFASKNIWYANTSTQFILGGKVYATEYKDQTGKRNIVLPSTSDLRDYILTGWTDSSGKAVTETSDIQIGSTNVYGGVTPRTYRIFSTENESIRWVVNDIEQGSSFEEFGVYGAPYKISIRSAPGYSDLPTIYMNGVQFTPGASFNVAGETSFTTSGGRSAQSDNILIPLLLILVILVLIAFAFFFALKNKGKKAK